jgi:hypothetical protein
MPQLNTAARGSVLIRARFVTDETLELALETEGSEARTLLLAMVYALTQRHIVSTHINRAALHLKFTPPLKLGGD